MQIRILLQIMKRSPIDIDTQISPKKRRIMQENTQLRRKVHVLQKRLHRRELTISTMRNLIDVLKTNNMHTPELEQVLISNFDGVKLECMLNECRNLNVAKTQRRYTPQMKQFALTLYFYSPKAYDFIRENLSLPHPSMLRKWLSNYNCNVGFLTEVFEYLQIEVPRKSYLKNVALIFDSMAIRTQIVHDIKADKNEGYVDYGGCLHYNSQDLATEALVFQIVSYTNRFKCPIAYFFVNKINANIQAQLIKVAIEKLYEVGIIVRSITCDGAKSNLATFTLLGCTITGNDITGFFKHPLNESIIYCILDPCHIIKLARNTFAECNITSECGPILFSYVEKLYALQEAEDLKLANKLSYKHIYFKNNKMNVRVAAQTLSSSVADAIDFLRTSGHKDFIGSEATTNFIRIIDKLFDIMNSRNSFGTGFKSPIMINNLELIKQTFDDSMTFISRLKINDKNIYLHSRHTFALGLKINAQNYFHLARDLLHKKEEPLKYFLTYKCSQDHLELYFSCIRRRGGWNNNPNVLQFKWALRQLLFRNAVHASVNANCLGDTFETYSVLQFRKPKRVVHDYDASKNAEESEEFLNMVDNLKLSPIQENIVYYIAGTIVRTLLKEIHCHHCANILIDHNMAISDKCHSYTININKYNAFTLFVNRGKLCYPSSAVFTIVETVEKTFKTELTLHGMRETHFKRNIVINTVQMLLPNIRNMFTPEHPVSYNIEDEDLHEIQIIKIIAAKYIKLRTLTYCKKATERHLKERGTSRQKLNKTILFYHV